jgi:hypothetical protein
MKFWLLRVNRNLPFDTLSRLKEMENAFVR